MHQEIYEKLKEIALAGRITYYNEIAPLDNLNMENPADRNRIAEILDEINFYEHKHERPMLSAVVIRKDINMPGEGFFECAKKLSRYRGSDKVVFWAHELIEVHKYWQAHQ